MTSVLPAAATLHGREAERDAVRQFLGRARDGAGGALVVVGSPGIGKSALLADAVAAAPDLRLLSAAGVEAESRLAFAALHQLLRPIVDLVVELPEPQGAAIRSAVGLAPPGGDDPFLVGAGVLSLFAAAAERAPLLVVVEDAHWLDGPSAAALTFAARRLDAEPVAMLIASRQEYGELDPAGLPQLHLTGIGTDAAEALIAERFGDDLAVAPRTRVIDLAEGNPLALLELPMALTEGQRAGREAIPELPPPTQRLENVYAARARALSPAAELFLLVAAADNTGDPRIVRRAADALAIGPADVEAVEATGLLRVSDTAVEWRHPLVRTAAYHNAPLTQRHEVHKVLGELLGDERDADRRALHLASATDGPDEAVASELERSAERARARGGFASAAAVLARSAELTPDEERRARRFLASAKAAVQAGDAGTCAPLLVEARRLTTDRTLTAQIDHLRGVIETMRGRPLVAYEILVAAAADLEEIDPAGTAAILLDAASAAGYAGASVEIDAGRRAEVLLPRVPDSFELRAVAGVGRSRAAAEGGIDLLREALALADSSDHPRRLIWAARCAFQLGDVSAARAYAAQDVDRARRDGAIAALVSALARVALAEIIDGRLASARANASEGFTLATEAALENDARYHQALLALVAAFRGDSAVVRENAKAVLDVARARGLGWHAALARFALGMLELAEGRPDGAVAHFRSLSTQGSLAASTYVSLLAAPAFVEAAVRAERPELAEEPMDRFERWAKSTGSVANLPLLERSRALLAQREEDADAHFTQALEAREVAANPLQRARTELLFGEFLRRAGRRRDARDHLRTAFDLFEELAATAWSERAAAELRATGETLVARARRGEQTLTPQELQVARFVATGATNKEVAAKLFLSPRTVDAHLRNVFNKLGISARSQLAQFELGGPAESRGPVS